ncbi:MAG: hypothetical protein ABIG85_03725 [Chloroflexota bacterium]
MGSVQVVARAVVGVVGVAIVLPAVRSAIRTLVLPRPAPDGLLAFVFVGIRNVLDAVGGFRRGRSESHP